MTPGTKEELSDSDAAGLAISRMEGELSALRTEVHGWFELMMREMKQLSAKSDTFIRIAERCFEQADTANHKFEELARNVSLLQTKVRRHDELLDELKPDA